jgi:hypothetical protein
MFSVDEGKNTSIFSNGNNLKFNLMDNFGQKGK